MARDDRPKSREIEGLKTSVDVEGVECVYRSYQCHTCTHTVSMSESNEMYYEKEELRRQRVLILAGGGVRSKEKPSHVGSSIYRARTSLGEPGVTLPPPKRSLQTTEGTE